METRIVEKLKEKIFSALIGVMSREEFSEWLYTDKDMIELINEDSFVFEVICLNYKTQSSLYSLKKLAFEKYSYDEFLVFMLEVNCSKLIHVKSFDEMYKIVLSIGEYHDWETSFSVIESFYYMDDDFSLVMDGFVWESESNLKERVIQYAGFVLAELRDRTIEEKIYFIKHAGYPKQDKVFVVDERIIEMKEEERKPFFSKKKRWYEFWK